MDKFSLRIESGFESRISLTLIYITRFQMLFYVRLNCLETSSETLISKNSNSPDIVVQIVLKYYKLNTGLYLLFLHFRGCK